eukprot:jgi/Mesvir1/8689/Mv02627-RA.1
MLRQPACVRLTGQWYRVGARRYVETSALPGAPAPSPASADVPWLAAYGPAAALLFFTAVGTSWITSEYSRFVAAVEEIKRHHEILKEENRHLRQLFLDRLAEHKHRSVQNLLDDAVHLRLQLAEEKLRSQQLKDEVNVLKAQLHESRVYFMYGQAHAGDSVGHTAAKRAPQGSSREEPFLVPAASHSVEIPLLSSQVSTSRAPPSHAPTRPRSSPELPSTASTVTPNVAKLGDTQGSLSTGTTVGQLAEPSSVATGATSGETSLATEAEDNSTKGVGGAMGLLAIPEPQSGEEMADTSSA